MASEPSIAGLQIGRGGNTVSLIVPSFHPLLLEAEGVLDDSSQVDLQDVSLRHVG
jgi:hypothetical protein